MDFCERNIELRTGSGIERQDGLAIVDTGLGREWDIPLPSQAEAFPTNRTCLMLLPVSSGGLICGIVRTISIPPGHENLNHWRGELIIPRIDKYGLTRKR